MHNPVSILRRMKNQLWYLIYSLLKALFPGKTGISVYFIPDFLSFCIPSVFIFIPTSCLGLVMLSTQL